MAGGIVQRMRWWERVAVLAVGLMASMLPQPALAHVRWFIEDEFQQAPQWHRLLTFEALLVPLVTGVLLVGLLVLRRVVGDDHFPNPGFLRYMEPSATLLLAVHTGISLVYFASQLRLFVPNLDLGRNLFGALLVMLQIVVAFTLITGLMDRGGAFLLGIVWLLGFAVFSPWQLLDQTLYVGISLALVVLGRTIPPPNIARRLLPLARYERQAVTGLRLLAGASFAFLGFSEKILAPEAAAAFLHNYPEFNVLLRSSNWTWWTDERFALAAGVVEASAGLLLMTGVMTRVVILILLVPFNLTVAFLPPIELLGHLPIFGIMYVLLLYGSGGEPRARERWLDPALEEAATAQGATAGGLPPESDAPDDRRPAQELDDVIRPRSV
jgi:uncharacterized membrane protein YphA (DoxX/SURF4 family)